MGRWKRKFLWEDKIRGVQHIVSIAKDDTWACDCKQWIFRRKVCDHILEVFKLFNEGLLPYDGHCIRIEEIDPELTGTIIRLAKAMGRED